MTANLERAVKFFIYATFFVPLLVVPSSFIFPFIVPKILLLRSLIAFMAGGYVLLFLSRGPEFKPRLHLLTIAALIFLLSFALSTFIGVDPYHSFWDNHERMLGLFTIFHYIVYYLICTTVLRTWTEWKWALRLFLLAGSIVMFIGVLQRVNPDLLLNQGSGRVASTLGNAIYVGGYGLFLFFVALLLMVKEKAGLWRWVYGGGMLLSLAGIFYSGTRGSLLGWIIGVGASILGYIVILKDHPRLRKGLVLGLIGVCALMVLLYFNRHRSFVAGIPGVSRLLNTSLRGDTSGTRFIAWRIAYEGWKDRPVFGWGPNNYFYAFNENYNPRSLEFGYGETWFDNAHNILLNTLAVQGTVGIVSYLFIFGAGWWMLWRSRELRVKHPHLTVLGSAFLLAHLVQNIFVFENPTSYLYFMFWLALINRLASVPAGEPTVVSARGKTATTIGVSANLKTSWVLGAAAGVAVIIFVFNIQPARANIKTLTAINEYSQSPLAGWRFITEVLKLRSPHIDDIRADIARMTMQVVASANGRLPKDTANETLLTSRIALEKNVELHPRDIRNYMMLAQIAQLSFSINNDPRAVLEAEQYLDTALKYSPKRQQLKYMASSLKAQLNKKDEALRLLEETISDDPAITEGYWRLGYLYFLFGDQVAARQTLARATERGLTFDEQGKQIEALIMAGSKANDKAK